MIDAGAFYREMKALGLTLFCGVPDSLLRDLCTCLADHEDCHHNIITANEGNALALAAGHYLACARPAVVYLQNSGQGNLVNPLLSLNDPAVYSIPALLIIGWRGEPGVHDEPQHITQGRLTLELLETLGVEYEILTDIAQIRRACEYMSSHARPFALVVKRGTFAPYERQRAQRGCISELSREQAICRVVTLMGERDVVVSTTGMISRELYENRTSHERDFLSVGSMGHASSIALGVALRKPGVRVFCFDGDGAALMHMGAMAVIGSLGPKNFRHIIFNNEAHDSVGGQPTVAGSTDFAAVARACGYVFAATTDSIRGIDELWGDYCAADGCALLNIRVARGARRSLGRPRETPVHNRELFMEHLRELSGPEAVGDS